MQCTFLFLKKWVLVGFHILVIFGFISISYLITNQFYQFPIFTHSWNFGSIPETFNISYSFDSESKCVGQQNRSRQNPWNIIHRDDTFNYLSFILRSHSLFYCSVPKVATRTFLTFLTYLHIRDDLIPLFSNNSTSNILNIPYINQTILSLIKNDSQSTTLNYTSVLQSFSSELIVNSSKMDIWSIYQRNTFPFIRPRSLTDPSLIFSSKYLRVIFVRHPLERLASAYIDKITSLNNLPFSTYDNIRRVICRRHSKFYLTDDERAFYRTRRRIIKEIDEPCQKIVPKFEHFIEYVMRDPYDVHWKPYSILCQVCLFKYNFIGKFETIEQDLRKIITYLGLKSKYWIKENYFNTGKTKENYKLLFSNLKETSICYLKYLYENDFTLFDYHIEDYITENTNINCSSIYFKKIKDQ